MNSVLRLPRPDFVPFNESNAVRIYRRNLPHWRLDGATYFITFRLGDSIPQNVRREWEYEKRKWLEARGIRYDGEHGDWRHEFEKLSANDQRHFHKYFNRQVHACLDRGIGNCWLKREDCIRIVCDKLLGGDEQRYHLGDAVIMPNHVHALITPADGEGLESIVKRIKGASAFECNRAIGRTGAFWQADTYDHIVRDFEELQFFRSYIESNPAKARIMVPEAAIYKAEWINDWRPS